MSTLNFAMLDPVTITSIAIFISVTATAWVVIGRISGQDKPRAETRLDLMHRRRVGPQLDKESENRYSRKNEALAAALERATQPLTETVSGTG